MDSNIIITRNLPGTRLKRGDVYKIRGESRAFNERFIIFHMLKSGVLIECKVLLGFLLERQFAEVQ